MQRSVVRFLVLALALGVQLGLIPSAGADPLTEANWMSGPQMARGALQLGAHGTCQDNGSGWARGKVNGNVLSSENGHFALNLDLGLYPSVIGGRNGYLMVCGTSAASLAGGCRLSEFVGHGTFEHEAAGRTYRVTSFSMRPAFVYYRSVFVFTAELEDVEDPANTPAMSGALHGLNPGDCSTEEVSWYGSGHDLPVIFAPDAD